MYSLLEDQDTRISRQPDIDCDAWYFDEDNQKMPCILQVGHDGKHIDHTGVEF